MLDKPIIGVGCHFQADEEYFAVRKDYTEAIERAGGLPIIIPIIDNVEVRNKLLSMCSGLLMTGGFGRKKITERSFIPLRDQHPERYDYDKYIIEYALENDVPFLGICRNHQMLNKVSNGTINLKLPTEQISHYQYTPGNQASHKVRVIQNTRLRKIVDADSLNVNSFHTQGIKQVAPGFIASAVSEDGLIEAIESNNHTFIMGLQFHPEKMPNEEFSRKIFTHFVDVCSNK
tara:strand:- start:1165 stop:1860 length:696 start_codon:yes stop_codon:yes gene_type:complete